MNRPSRQTTERKDRTMKRNILVTDDVDTGRAQKLKALAEQHTAIGQHTDAAKAHAERAQIFELGGDAKATMEARKAAADSLLAHVKSLDDANGGPLTVEKAAAMRGSLAAPSTSATAADGSDLIGYEKYCHDMTHPKRERAARANDGAAGLVGYEKYCDGLTNRPQRRNF